MALATALTAASASPATVEQAQQVAAERPARSVPPMWLKGCPRCRGDLFEEPAIGARSQAFTTITCLQCGYQPTEQEERRIRASQAHQRPAPRPRVA